MHVKLELDTDRYSPKDRGHFLDVVGSEAWEQRQAAQGIILEPASGFLMLAPDWTYDGKPKADFTLSDPDNWDEIPNCWLFSGLAIHHRAIAETEARYTATLEKNQATLLGLHVAEPTAQAPITLQWGIQDAVAQLVVTLEPGRKPRADLLDISQPPPYPTMSCEMLDGPILNADALYGKPFGILCMPLRQRLLLHSDLWGDWFISPEWSEKPSWIDGSGDAHYYCLRDGQFAIQAEAILYMAFRPLTYAETGEFEIPFELDYTPTVMPTSDLDWETFTGTGALLEVLRTNGDPYQVGDQGGKVRVSLIGPGSRTPIINKLVVLWEPTAEFRAGNPVEPHLLRLDERLSADPATDSIACTIRPGPGEEGLWKRPNLPFVVTVDGDTVRMVGLADQPRLVESESDEQIYEMSLRSGWKRLEHALLARVQARAYDGMPFSDVITELLRIAGADESEIHVTANATELPVAEAGQKPLYMFSPGVSVSQAIEQLRDDWATDWILYHAPDGFHVAPAPTGAPAYTFIRATDDRSADPAQVCRAGEAWSDDTYFINWLIVWGRDDEGHLIHSEVQQDLASINDPEAPDYVGELRMAIILNSSANTIAKCDLIADKAWPVWNSIPRFIRWRAPFVKTLRPHALVLIQDAGGDPADDLTVRILDMRTSFVPNLGLSDYFGEVIP